MGVEAGGDLMPMAAIDIKNRPRHPSVMRTRLTLDDDVLELATRQARLRGLSLGKAVPDFLRQGLSASTPVREGEGLVMFQLPADSPGVTTEDVRRIEAEGS